MSTADKNLSDLDYNLEGDTAEIRIAIVVSEWNAEITGRLKQGCRNALKRMGIKESYIREISVPGSFELPMGAQMIIEACDPQPSAVVCLGSIIRGETSHFEYVCQAASQGIKDVGLKYNIPVIFGVLTDNNKEQSLARSGGNLGNKGEEAAVSAVKMALLPRKIRR